LINKTSNRSPLKANPLPNAGDSIQKHIEEVTDNNKLFPLEIAFMFCCIAAFQWFYFSTGSPPNPIIWTIIAIIAIGYSVFSILRANRKLKNLRLGRDGEKAVGQYLELLCEKGAKVFHDCSAGNFNIDHIVIHSSLLQNSSRHRCVKDNNSD
jgi:Nuclease-related domain